MKGREGPGIFAKKLFGLLNKYKFVGLVILAGLVLLMLPAFQEEGEPAAPAAAAAPAPDREELEERLEDALSRIEGAGRARVVLTVRSGPRQILAQDGKTTEKGGDLESQVSTVVVSRGSGLEEPVTLQEVAPQYQGALVVCPGGDLPEVRLQIAGAVSALTGLGTDKIFICKGN